MKALSIKQPWLYCITDLDKRVENRTWEAPGWIIGQRIALHASKTLDHEGKRAASELAGFKLSTVVDDMPFGAIVATAVVLGWVHQQGDASHLLLSRHRNSKWFFGPFGWVLDDVRKLAVPVPCSGRLGLWDAPTAVSQEEPT
jgi:hypothetical protein